MSEPLYLVAGAAGHTGALVASRLLDRKKKVRVLGRSAERLKTFTARGAEAAVGSLEDPAFLRSAFAGVGAAYLLLPPNPAAKGFRAFQGRVTEAITAALEAARVSHALTLSSIGADLPEGNGPIAGLHGLEQRLNRIAGLNVLHLRPGYFMENHLAGIGMVKGMGIYGSALRPDLRFVQIATPDIGEVAARRLLALDFQGKGVQELHGPREITMAEATAAIGRAIGKPDLAYVQFPYADARKGMVGMGLPEEMADLYVEMSRGFNDGRIVATQPRSSATTTPTTIEKFAEAVFAPAFRSS